MNGNLLEAFKNYIEACKEYKKEIGILRDIATFHELIANLEKQQEFDELIRQSLYNEKISKWAEADRDSIRDLLNCFFMNSLVYNEIVYGEEFDIEKQFDKFIEETEKQIEVHTSGELVGLAVEFGNAKEIRLGEFSIENRGEIWSYLMVKDLFDHPNIVNLRDPKELPIFAINLYFDKPIYLSALHTKSNSLFSYQEQENPLRHNDPYLDFIMIKEMVDKKFNRCEKSEDPGLGKITFPIQSPDPDFVKAIGVDNGEFFNLELDCDEGINCETYDNVLKKAAEYFISKGEIGNYLSHSEMDKFRGFVIKMSELCQRQKYFPVAVHYFEQNNEGQLPGSNIINYVTALESLYFADREDYHWKKFPKRITNLLGETDTERSELEDFLSKIYDVRCSYVHGSIVNLNEALIKKFGDNVSKLKIDIWIRNIVRESILAFLSLSKHYDSKSKREKLLNKLSNQFDSENEKIQKQASELLSMVRG